MTFRTHLQTSLAMVPETRRAQLSLDQWPLPPFSPVWRRVVELRKLQCQVDEQLAAAEAADGAKGTDE